MIVTRLCLFGLIPLRRLSAPSSVFPLLVVVCLLLSCSLLLVNLPITIYRLSILNIKSDKEITPRSNHYESRSARGFYVNFSPEPSTTPKSRLARRRLDPRKGSVFETDRDQWGRSFSYTEVDGEAWRRKSCTSYPSSAAHKSYQ